MRYLVIREDGIIVGDVLHHSITNEFDDTTPHGPLEPFITRAIERPGAKAKLYVIEPSPTGRAQSEPNMQVLVPRTEDAKKIRDAFLDEGTDVQDPSINTDVI